MDNFLKPFKIGIPIFEGVDLLDVTGPYEVLVWLSKNYIGQQKFSVNLLAKELKPIESANGVQVMPQKKFSQVEALDLLLVPGASPAAMNRQMADLEFNGYMQQWAKQVSHLSSVCVGSLLLANAGLLDGYRATSHWAYLPCFSKLFPKVKVAAGYPRFVIDNSQPNGPVRITGGGISSGLDLSLQLVLMLAGENTAKQAQVAIQYFPKPPVDANLEKIVHQLKQSGQYCCPL